MKKLLRLAFIFLTPLLLVVFTNVALAKMPIARPQIGQTAIQARLDSPLIPPSNRLPSNQGPITGLAITDLSVTHTTPALLNEPVFFTATVLPISPFISYNWSFGDGSSSGPTTNAVVSHTYDMPGPYVVEVTAQDVDGPVKHSILIIVTVQRPLELSIVHSTPTLVNTPIDFTAVQVGGTKPISYVWSFGDGVQLTDNPGPTISHTYTMTGTYPVVVTASNVAGFVKQTTMITVEAQSITGLAITHSSPLMTDIPVVFTATKLTGTPSISYAWIFSDDPGFIFFDAGPVQSHVFTIPDTYTITVIASNKVGPPVFTSTVLSISKNPAPPFIATVYLPFILKDGIFKADLTCSLSITPTKPTADQDVLITVEIRNQGLLDADGFWVDLYLDPDTIPGPGDLFPWQDACGGPSSCTRGIAWGIADNPLGPGQTRLLTSVPMTSPQSGGYVSGASKWDGRLSAGRHDIYVYVDSIDNPVLADTDGTVMEANEQNNLCKPAPLRVVVSPSEVGVGDRLPAVLEPNQADDQSTSGSEFDSQSQPWFSKLPPR